MPSNVLSSFLLRGSAVLLLTLVLVTRAAAMEPQEVDTTGQSILHMVDYIAVDYREVVRDGTVVNDSEYEEQKEFSRQVLALVRKLPRREAKAALLKQAGNLQTAILQRAPGEQVAMLCRSLASELIAEYQITVEPKAALPVAQARTLYQENCAGCHGAEGRGDGPSAGGLDPAPANFHDRGRQRFRSVSALYNAISLGVADTAMPAFPGLTPEQRWALAFYVSDFFATGDERRRGGSLWADDTSRSMFPDLRWLSRATPAEVEQRWGEAGTAILAYLRANPDLLRSSPVAPLEISRENLIASLDAYKDGRQDIAYRLAVTAYLDGFELIEARLDSIEPGIRKEIEQDMGKYRNLIRSHAPVVEVHNVNANLIALLNKVDTRLTDSGISPTTNYLTALLILLREGLEAILVLAAISAVLVKSERIKTLRYIHIGWIAALLLGLITWFAADYLIAISGADRELTEGVTALVAAAMLIYVGFWLHNQVYSVRWRDFIRLKVANSVTRGTLFGLAVVAFVAVYREVFESVLFYKTLWLQVQTDGHAYIIAGAATAVLLLALIAWAIFRLSVRLPLKLFFKVNAAFLLVLAVVFAGKGVAALQEAGNLPVSPITFPQIDALGIYPNLQSLGLQATLIAITVIGLWWSRVKMNRYREGDAMQS